VADDLGGNRKHLCNFLLVIIICSNFGRTVCISHHFGDINQSINQSINIEA